MRKNLIAEAAVIALGAATITSTAFAAPHGGGTAGYELRSRWNHE